MESICVLVDLALAIVSFVYKSINDAIVVKYKLKTLGYAPPDSKSAIAVKAFSVNFDEEKTK